MRKEELREIFDFYAPMAIEIPTLEQAYNSTDYNKVKVPFKILSENINVIVVRSLLGHVTIMSDGDVIMTGEFQRLWETANFGEFFCDLVMLGYPVITLMDILDDSIHSFNRALASFLILYNSINKSVKEIKAATLKGEASIRGPRPLDATHYDKKSWYRAEGYEIWNGEFWIECNWYHSNPLDFIEKV